MCFTFYLNFQKYKCLTWHFTMKTVKVSHPGDLSTEKDPEKMRNNS